jgi:glycosyltransferase involved in cell wall biosynthesis
MLIILYSETTADTISTNLGNSEYSYYFVLKKYLPILETLGELAYVTDPATEVDPLYEQELVRGGEAIFLSFSPPHRTVVDLKCPTVCILAWEFSTVPNEDWGRDPRDNWVESIRKIKNIITISEYSTEVIRAQIGGDINIATIPSPVTDRSQPEQALLSSALDGFLASGPDKSLLLTAEVIDTSELDISEDIVCFKASDASVVSRKGVLPWDGQSLEFQFDAVSRVNNGYRYLVGFYDPEGWGAWSRSSRPWISLPVSLEGAFDLDLDLVAFADNDQREIKITIGHQTRTLVVDTTLRTHRLHFSGVEKASRIEFSDLTVGYTVGADLLRALSLGIGKLILRRLEALPVDSALDEPVTDRQVIDLTDVVPNQPEPVELKFDGLVYTSMFNPEDGRKNWEDIVTAFCWAFRDDPSKTLILKFTCPSMSSTWGRLFLLFSQLCPFSCRIVVVHGFLVNDEMAALIDVTDYIVNASKAEGQCLPLLEFMAEGVPAIAPDHTAMSSYINSQNALVVKSSRVATCWPHDPREYERTFFYRIDWSSLLEAYISSAEILESDPRKYRRMAYSAASVVCTRFSSAVIGRELAQYVRAFEV